MADTTTTAQEAQLSVFQSSTGQRVSFLPTNWSRNSQEGHLPAVLGGRPAIRSGGRTSASRALPERWEDAH
ncbi:hypothetical protein HNY73_004645 [Argiope bruennichi]|uniref:Uncharacterized protein n=1 Tax=Argiope bruennichi TaxID=94029 RepID=A0A8T0FR87_ARGBR|nr:hypothetical protein HNY73_004645 [Argiope bruennichi]